VDRNRGNVDDCDNGSYEQNDDFRMILRYENLYKMQLRNILWIYSMIDVVLSRQMKDGAMMIQIQLRPTLLISHAVRFDLQLLLMR